MHHSHRLAGRRCHHVDLRVQCRKSALQNDHGEHTRTGGHVAGALRHAVRRGHAGSGVTLRRSHRNARLQLTGGIEQLRALGGQNACVLARGEHLRQQLHQRLCQRARRDNRVELREHIGVIGAGCAVDREHAGCFAHTHDSAARQLPVQVTRECGEEIDLRRVRFTVQNRLIQVRHAPALRDVEGEQLAQRRRGLLRRGVAPGAEAGKLVALGVKRQIAVHHGREAERADRRHCLAIFFLDLRRHLGVSVLYTRPSVVEMIGPVAVLKPVFPVVRAAGQYRVIGTDQNSLDACGAQLDAERRLVPLNHKEITALSDLRGAVLAGRAATAYNR